MAKASPDIFLRSANHEDSETRRCDHEGCDQPGEHRAPKNRTVLNDYYWFCLSHVRDYNRAWNFFEGMSEDQINRYRKDDVIGHRPTWRMGILHPDRPFGDDAHDPFDMMREAGFEPERRSADGKNPPRPLKESEKRAFEMLDLDPTATKEQIKKRHKELVKRFHPDANGGDKKAEEHLKSINQAYTELMSSGYS